MASLEHQMKQHLAYLKRVEGKLDLLLEKQGLAYSEPPDAAGPPSRAELKTMNPPPEPAPAPTAEPSPQGGEEHVEVGPGPLDLQPGKTMADKIEEVASFNSSELEQDTASEGSEE